MYTFVPYLCISVVHSFVSSSSIGYILTPPDSLTTSLVFPPIFAQHNEALSVSTFLNGVIVYEAIIPALADAPSTLETDAAAAQPDKQAANLQCHEVSARIDGEDAATTKRRKVEGAQK